MTVVDTEGRRTPPLVAAAFGLIIVLLLVSIGLQAGVINPTTQSNHSELSSQGAEIKEVACATAESAANAFRVRSEDPRTGKLETVSHFLTRMLAQRHQLKTALPLGCTSARGFPPFRLQVDKALREIDTILSTHPTVERRHTGTATPRAAAGRPAGAATSEGGDAALSLSTGHSQSAPGDGGHEGSRSGGHGGVTGITPAHQGGRQDTGPAAPPPAAPTSASSSQSSTSSTSSTTESTVVEPAPEPVTNGVGHLVEGVGTTVEEVGGTVNETVCGLTGALGAPCG